MGLVKFIPEAKQLKSSKIKKKKKKKVEKKTDKTYCKKCRKKVEAIETKDLELICPNCERSLGFISIPPESKNYLLEMVQNYINFNKINAKAIIDDDGFLAFLIDFNTEDTTELSDLLSKCIPISYSIVNTALSENQDIEKPKPIDEKPKPIDEKPKPIDEKPKPIDEKPKPIDEKPKPKPIDEKPKPKPKPKPIDEKPKPKPKPKPIDEKPKPKSKPKPKKVKIDSYQIDNLVIDYRSKEWCKLPYQPLKDKKGRLKRDREGNIKYQYSKGCPNYNKKKSCPPFSKKIEDVFDITDKIWFLVARFNLKKHYDKQRKKHPAPEWSDKQCYNPRHWQNSVVSQLNKACINFVAKTDLIYDLCPESMGVHVFKSMKKLKILLEKRPKILIHKVAIIGTPKKKKKELKQLMSFLS